MAVYQDETGLEAIIERSNGAMFIVYTRPSLPKTQYCVGLFFIITSSFDKLVHLKLQFTGGIVKIQ